MSIAVSMTTPKVKSWVVEKGRRWLNSKTSQWDRVVTFLTMKTIGVLTRETLRPHFYILLLKLTAVAMVTPAIHTTLDFSGL